MTPREVLKRLTVLEAKVLAETVPFELKDILFEKQLPFGVESTRWQTAVCTRRAGKTYACAAKLLDVARAKAGCVSLYITLSRLNAKRIIWDTLKELNALYSLGGVPLEAELCLALPNGSRVYLSGASDEGEIEKFRGLPVGIVLVDEAQSLPGYLKKMVDEVLAPALMDYAGALVLIGTPGPVPTGYFHECATNATWAHHSWSVMDNPHILRKSGRTPRALLEEEMQRRGVAEDDPVIQREWFGRWVLDTNSLVFRFDTKKNVRRVEDVPGAHYSHVIGIDLGFDDADAIAVLRWADGSPDLELVYEWVGAKQTISVLMAQVQAAYDKYKPLAVVADTGGLGKKIAEEIQSRTGIPIEAADKQRKLEHIELLNDAMRTGKLFAPPGSRFGEDCLLAEWDKSNPEKPKISDRFHSDICDAVLYAYMRCLQWLYVPPPSAGPKVNTPEWFEAQARREKEQLEEMLERDMEQNRQDIHAENEANQWD